MKDKSTNLGTEDVQNMLANSLGNITQGIKSTSRIHQVSVLLFFSQLNIFAKRISQHFPAVIQTLSPTTGSYSSRNISQFSHW